MAKGRDAASQCARIVHSADLDFEFTACPFRLNFVKSAKDLIALFGGDLPSKQGVSRG